MVGMLGSGKYAISGVFTLNMPAANGYIHLYVVAKSLQRPKSSNLHDICPSKVKFAKGTIGCNSKFYYIETEALREFFLGSINQQCCDQLNGCAVQKLRDEGLGLTAAPFPRLSCVACRLSAPFLCRSRSNLE